MTLRTAGRVGARAGLALAVLAVALLLPTQVLAVTSGGWNNLGHGTTSTTPPLNGKVETFYDTGTVLYVGGDFTNAGGLAAGDHIAKWNGTSWSALGVGLGDAASAVYAITSDPTTGLIFAAGSFQNAGGDVDADLVAMYNGSTWAHLPNVALNGTVFALTVIGRYLYIAGGFSKQPSGTLADGIVRWNIDTHVEEAVSVNTSAIGGTPAAIVPDGSGGFYLGGNFANVDNIAAADYVARWSGGSWSALGSIALNARVRALSMDGGNLFVGGEFTGAGGASGADKVAEWNGTSWSAIGGSTFFGTSAAVIVYGIWADHGTVVASGYFNNAGGLSKADGIAAFNGTNWTNVGTSASGTDGPVSLNTQMLCVRVVSGKLYLGGLDSSIADSTMLGYAAWYRYRQPDAQIKTATSAFAGNNIYNTTGKKQTKSLTVHRNQTGTFSIQIANDGFVADTITVKGPGSSGGFTATYLAGATNVTAQVVAGTYTMNDLPSGASRTLTLQVTVGGSVSVGAVKSFLVTASSTGAGTTKDAVKAKVTAS
jgi:hypothetical protein